MNPRWLRSTLAAVLAAAAATAATAADFTDYAPVVATAPVYERVNAPRQECWNETVTVEPAQPAAGNGAATAGTIIGGIVGGVAGHQVGGGRGKDVATVAGAITGALIGNNIGGRQARDPAVVYGEPETRVVQRCQTVDAWQDVVRGYDVTYRYAGRDATVRLPYDPGREVRVAVGIVADAPRAGLRRQPVAPLAAPAAASRRPPARPAAVRIPGSRRGSARVRARCLGTAPAA